jgi:hypothetical protein
MQEFGYDIADPEIGKGEIISQNRVLSTTSNVRASPDRGLVSFPKFVWRNGIIDSISVPEVFYSKEFPTLVLFAGGKHPRRMRCQGTSALQSQISGP